MKQENIVYGICVAIWAVIAFFFIRLGFFVPQTCDLDKEFLYCHLHPMGVLSTIGLVLYGLSSIFITGVWKFITGEVITDKAGTYAIIGFVVGALGIGLIFAQ